MTLAVAPPSVVFTSWLPAVTVRMHSGRAGAVDRVEVVARGDLLCFPRFTAVAGAQQRVRSDRICVVCVDEVNRGDLRAGGSVTWLQDTPPSGVMYAALRPELGSLTKAMPTVADEKVKRDTHVAAAAARGWRSQGPRSCGQMFHRRRGGLERAVVEQQEADLRRDEAEGRTPVLGQPDSETLKIRVNV